MKFPDSLDRKSKSLNATVITGSRATTHINDGIGIRKLTPIECERLQTLPDGYTEGISNMQRYKALGNGFTVDVMAHILKHIK
jgi:site-specific DNA-cytosine methylase